MDNVPYWEDYVMVKFRTRFFPLQWHSFFDSLLIGASRQFLPPSLTPTFVSTLGWAGVRYWCIAATNWALSTSLEVNALCICIVSFQKKNCSFYGRRIHALPKFADGAYFYSERMWLRRVKQPNTVHWNKSCYCVFLIIDPCNWQDTVDIFMTRSNVSNLWCFVENKCKWLVLEKVLRKFAITRGLVAYIYLISFIHIPWILKV
jgi:hypothetical protein